MNVRVTGRKKRTYDFFEKLESVARLWRVMGLFPFTVTAPLGARRYDLSKFFAFYSLVIFAVCTGNFAWVIINFDKYFRKDAFRLVSVTILIRAIGNIACLFFSIVFRIRQYTELSTSVTSLSEHDIILERMNCRSNHESSARSIRVYVWTSIIIVVLLMVYDAAVVGHYHKILTIEYVLWDICLIIQVIDLTVFASLVGLLGTNFRALNEKIRTVVTRANAPSLKIFATSDVCAENLRALSKLHYEMCTLGKRINRIYDWDIVINVVIAFIVMSTTLYYIFYEVNRDGETNVIQIVSYIQWEIFHSFPIISIVVACNLTSRQSVRAGKLIHEIRVEKEDSRLYEAVKSFSLQLHHQNLQFTARGFFPINSALLQTMIGKITTYLVILIQFEPRLD